MSDLDEDRLVLIERWAADDLRGQEQEEVWALVKEVRLHRMRRAGRSLAPEPAPTSLVLDIWIDGIPMTKGSWRIYGRKLVPDNEGEPAWAAAVGWAARAKLRNAPAVKARYAVRLEFTLPAPKGHKLFRRDLDKLMRSCLDALEGIVWTNDEQVEWCQLEKMRGDTPGARIIVERIGG